MKRGDGDTIGDRLREAREDAGYASAADAARAFGFNPNRYTSAENGNRPPGRQSAVRYAKAFRVSLDWLLEGRIPKAPSGAPSGADVLLHGVPVVRAEDVGELPILGARRTDADFRKFLAAVSKRELVPEDEAPPRAMFIFVIPRDHHDSMVDPGGSRLSLYPDDEVFIDPGQAASPGDMILARDGRRGLVRILGQTEAGKNRIVLMPRNADYGTLEIDRSGIIGPVTGIHRRLRPGAGRTR